MRVSRTTKKVGTERVATCVAQALDDGVGVPTVTFCVGDRTIHAGPSGRATVPAARGRPRLPVRGALFKYPVAGDDGPVAVTTRLKDADARALRADFPIFEQQFHGKPLAFLDFGARARRSRGRCSTR